MQKAPCNRWREVLKKSNKFFNGYTLAFCASKVKRFFFASPYDRLLAAIATHSLDDALTVLERWGCHDPSVQVAILAACQRRDVEVCDA